jgi:hypothetical protein
MKRFPIVVLVLLSAASVPLAAGELPDCGDQRVREILVMPLYNISIRQSPVRELSPPGAVKKWCISTYDVPRREVIYTIEWINEEQNKFWVEIKKR